MLSVIIATHDAAATIDTCLHALAPQYRAGGLEVIVADSSTDDTPAVVAAQFPWVRLLRGEPALTVPQLRGRGIAAATGDLIAILDPFSVAAPDWAERVRAAHAAHPNTVIGGAVGLHAAGTRGWSAWTLYFNEYGLFMPPVRPGETWIVPGSNVTYKRAALYDGSRPRYPVFWKTFVNWELERGGLPLLLADDVRVELNKPIPFLEFLRSRYDHGRCFAGMRGADESTGVRLLRAASAGLLPALLSWRWTRGFWPKNRHRARFVATLPGQLLLFAVWALGEASGYLRGSGRSCGRLFY